jgi:hypothetical protein
VPPLRFLLDQGFPKPPEGLHVELLDKSARYVHVSDELSALTRISTPDWILYLAARRAGFDAFVSRDLSQFDQREEMLALFLTGLTLVTWAQPIEDPVAEWGQLLAYGPQIERAMRRAEYRPSVFQLPAPRLSSVRQSLTRQRVQTMAAEARMSLPEYRDGALRGMREYLRSTTIREHAELLTALEDTLARDAE